MTDKFIRFSNDASFVSRIALEKLGYSTKRNDPSTIGRFGSGIKFAPIAALRQGLEWYFTGVDNSGPYVMSYAVQEEDGIDCIVYDYGDYQKPSSFTVDAGVLSWVDSFQIYREALANAMDSVTDGGSWSVDIVDRDQIQIEPGKFCCYISASSSMLSVHNNFDKYFCVNRKRMLEQEHVFSKTPIYLVEKIDNTLRVYSHSILVYNTDEFDSIFDYDMNHLELNEERSVKSLYSLEADIARMICRLSHNSTQRKFIEVGMSTMVNNYFEFVKISDSTYSYMDVSLTWASTFNEMYKTDSREIVIYDELARGMGADSYIELKGFKPVYVHSAVLYSILIKAGVTSYLEIEDESFKYETDFELSNHPKLKQAINIASYYEVEIGNLALQNRIGLYFSETGTLGLTINMSKPIEERLILIEKRHLEDNVANIVATLIHEYDHLSSGHGDGNSEGRMFRQLADARIGQLMVKNFPGLMPFVDDAVLSFDTQDLMTIMGNSFSSKFRVELVSTINRIILVMGKIKFLINDDALFGDEIITEPREGKVNFNDDGSRLVLNNLTNVEFVEVLNV